MEQDEGHQAQHMAENTQAPLAEHTKAQPLAESGFTCVAVENVNAHALAGSGGDGAKAQALVVVQPGHGDGAQTQPLAGSGARSSFFQAAASSVGASLVEVPEPEEHAQPLASEGGEHQLALIAMRSCMQELQAMKELQEWGFLWTAAQRHVIQPRRAFVQLLCQLLKEEGPASPSLKQCGMHAFSHGDGLEIAYVSPAVGGINSIAAAKQHASLELLCFLLVIAPPR